MTPYDVTDSRVKRPSSSCEQTWHWLAHEWSDGPCSSVTLFWNKEGRTVWHGSAEIRCWWWSLVLQGKLRFMVSCDIIWRHMISYDRCIVFSGRHASCQRAAFRWHMFGTTHPRPRAGSTTLTWPRSAGRLRGDLLLAWILAISRDLKWWMSLRWSSLSTLCPCGTTPPRKCSMWTDMCRFRKQLHYIPSHDVIWYNIMSPWQFIWARLCIDTGLRW